MLLYALNAKALDNTVLKNHKLVQDGTSHSMNFALQKKLSDNQFSYKVHIVSEEDESPYNYKKDETTKFVSLSDNQHQLIDTAPCSDIQLIALLQKLALS